MKGLKHTLMVAMAVVATLLNAQIETPPPSPGSTIKQKVGLTDVTIEYSRPSMKGRSVFGTGGLVPFGEIWRTGANTATRIEFSTDVKVEGVEVKKGAYAILTKPGADAWAVHFYKHDNTNFGSYTTKTPDAAVSVKPMKSGNKVETFTMNLEGLTNTGAILQMMWDNTIVPVNISIETDKTVVANIERVMAGPSVNDFFNAATYYHESGKDLNKALEWVQKATKVKEPKFWQVRREALILADLGRKAEAIAAAKLSLDLSKAANNMDYVRMNEKSLAEWAK